MKFMYACIARFNKLNIYQSNTQTAVVMFAWDTRNVYGLYPTYLIVTIGLLTPNENKIGQDQSPLAGTTKITCYADSGKEIGQ